MALGAFGGRFDQEIASVHALYKWKGMIERLILMDRENIVFLLDGHGKLQGEVAANNITHRKVSENDNLLGLTQNKGKIHDILGKTVYHCMTLLYIINANSELKCRGVILSLHKSDERF